MSQRNILVQAERSVHEKEMRIPKYYAPHKLEVSSNAKRIGYERLNLHKAANTYWYTGLELWGEGRAGYAGVRNAKVGRVEHGPPALLIACGKIMGGVDCIGGVPIRLGKERMDAVTLL